MKIYALQNSELEKVFKSLYEQFEYEKLLLFNIVEECTGMKPDNYSYCWHSGITCIWSYETLSFEENSKPHNVCRYQRYGETYYRPDRRTKKGIELIQKWKDTFKGIDGNILLKFGIPLNDKTNNMYYNWMPCKDEDKYGIIVSLQILNSLIEDEDQQYYLCP